MKNLLSLYISIANFTSVGILAYTVKHNIVESIGWIEPILALVGIYCVSSIFTSIIAIMIGFIAVKDNINFKLNTFGIILNTVYFVGVIIIIRRLWPALMGV